MTFEIITTIVVFVIFSVFYIAANKAEKFVAAKAKANLELQRNRITPEVSLPKKAVKKGNPSKKKVIV